MRLALIAHDEKKDDLVAFAANAQTDVPLPRGSGEHGLAFLGFRQILDASFLPK